MVSGAWRNAKSATRHHYDMREKGVERSLQTLLKIDHKDGFDCPSGAWPDPDGERKTAHTEEAYARGFPRAQYPWNGPAT
jgi:hypothetical protein